MSDDFLSRYLRRATLTIPAGQSVTSAPMEAHAMTVLWVQIPASMDGAVLTALAGPTADVAQAVPLVGEFGQRSLATYSNFAARIALSLGPARIAGHEFVWLRTAAAGDGATAVNQASSRTLTVCMRHIL
jgi:hypothetical protein